ncbi:alpha-(1,3)-fucosyltransferase C-like [Helicoverpa zea]|uniref:alpha-(1,3)-fucosyltransferase C-like n=1 Tax=Helicoverpa zea TaxID=7113 RepID=UPI001F567655|nr:alpha-(1,3)-fucosyltransferase C-like [Helicoverpa zea]
MRKFTTKLFVCVLFSAVFIITLHNYHIQQRNISLLKSKDRYFEFKKAGMKYILLWTKQENIPFAYIGQGQSGFIGRNCEYTNCIVSDNESDLGSTAAFDAVLFAGPELIGTFFSLPEERLPYQKFVFASIESPGNYPLCRHNFNGYFNWTWTYKLDSDLRWGYITIKDANNSIVGPKKDMNWIPWKEMDPVNATFKKQLKSKSKAVAWFVSHCQSRSRREDYAAVLKEELMVRYDLNIDVYGDCGSYSCPREEEDKCNELIAKDYFFYLSFENAFSEDYVTEKLLHPLQNNAVPIVFGGANYSRFLPEQSYLNARDFTTDELAGTINDLINNPDDYAEYFRWKKYYSYHKTTKVKETNEYCQMCAALNDDKLIETTSVYDSFKEFWEVYTFC